MSSHQPPLGKEVIFVDGAFCVGTSVGYYNCIKREQSTTLTSLQPSSSDALSLKVVPRNTFLNLIYLFFYSFCPVLHTRALMGVVLFVLRGRNVFFSRRRQMCVCGASQSDAMNELRCEMVKRADC